MRTTTPEQIAMTIERALGHRVRHVAPPIRHGTTIRIFSHDGNVFEIEVTQVVNREFAVERCWDCGALGRSAGEHCRRSDCKFASEEAQPHG